ncbi:MAG: PilZ domain-containing protein [Sphingorhabdus sp.]
MSYEPKSPQMPMPAEKPIVASAAALPAVAVSEGRQGDEAETGTKNDDRRSLTRHTTVMRAARLTSTIHRVEGLGMVRNLSEGGMMIDAYQSFGVGEHIVISLLDGDRVEGEVMWKNGTTIGVQFASWIGIDHMLARPRVQQDGVRVRAPRLTLNRKGSIRIGGFMSDMEICDISQRGAKIKFASDLEIDSRVQISHGHLRPVSGSVKWQAGSLVGIEFHRTLSVEELAKWVPDMSDVAEAIKGQDPEAL